MEYDPEEQFQLMHRGFVELKQLATNLGQTAVIGDPKPRDAAKNFFVNCYHFKEWLKKADGVASPQDVEKHISASRPLSMAADFCNSFKHAGLGDRAPRSGDPLNAVNIAYTIHVPPGGSADIKIQKNPQDGDTLTTKTGSHSDAKTESIATAVMILTVGGAKYDAVETAQECIDSWDVFLASQGLSYDRE